jgi:hypothetical protein
MQDARWVPKMLTGAHEMQRMPLALTSLEGYHKDGDEFLSHIVRVRSDETWVSVVNVETKEQSKQWMHTHSLDKPKKFKQTSARKLVAAAFWDSKVVLMLESMLQGTTIMSEVYCETLKKASYSQLFRTRGVEC